MTSTQVKISSSKGEDRGVDTSWGSVFRNGRALTLSSCPPVVPPPPPKRIHPLDLAAAGQPETEAETVGLLTSRTARSSGVQTGTTSPGQ